MVHYRIIAKIFNDGGRGGGVGNGVVMKFCTHWVK